MPTLQLNQPSIQQSVPDSPSVLSPPTLSHLPGIKTRTFRRRDHVMLGKGTLWQIEQGVVRTSTWDEAGNVIPLGFWGAGDIVGQPLSRIDPYQIECLTEVTALALPETYRYPQQIMVSHIQQMEELLRIMHSGSIEKRLLRFLMWIAGKFGYETEQGQLIKLRLTHQEIADVIGTSRVTATRLLGKFQQEGILSWSRRRHILLSSSTDLQDYCSSVERFALGK